MYVNLFKLNTRLKVFKNMVEFQRRRGESFEVFLRRFNKALQQSKKLFIVKQQKYQLPKKNKTAQKKYALISMKLRAKKQYLKKIGKLPEEEFFKKRGI